MDENNIHTSVVIEIANQEGPEDQKTYQIDFHDLDSPKDYILDQVFCGENVTVYAIIELPEDLKNKAEDNVIKVSNTQEAYRFIQKNSSNKKIEYKENLSLPNPKEPAKNVIKNENLYCLKHVSGDYEMHATEKSDLEVLYKNSVVSPTKTPMRSAPFKTVSKGVNTDIVQSPKIIQEVQKAVKLNFPSSKPPGDKTLSSKKSSYEVIEMEMRQSFSSFSSFDSKKHGKSSSPNFFIVPLLMMEDGVLSHFQKDETREKHSKDNFSKAALSRKVSTCTNTDFPDMRKPDPLPRLVNETDTHPKLNNKSSILNEIKNLQGKLNSLIKSIESNNFDFDEKPDETTNLEILPNNNIHKTSETVFSKAESVKTNIKKYDDLPISSSLTYPDSKKSERKKNQTGEEKPEISLTPTKSISIDCLSSLNPSKSVVAVGEKLKENLKKEESFINWAELESRRGAGLSKSATGHSLDSKYNFALKKSLSFDCKNEMYYLKKTKNNPFKLETKPNNRICQKAEPNLKCEMGDEAFNKRKTSRVDLIRLSQAIEKLESLKLDRINPKNILPEEEGDAKSVYSKQNLLSQMLGRKPEKLEVHFCNTNMRRSENVLSSEKSILPQPMKFKATYPNLDSGTKATSDSEKPATPNKSFRKGQNTNQTPKKEIKTIKKPSNQSCASNLSKKIREKTSRADLPPPQELFKQRSVTGSRKFTLRGTAESKLHVDRLMKQEALNKAASSERGGTKGDRSPRLQYQKKEPVIDCDKEKIEKITKEESFTVIHKKETKENSECAIILDSQEVPGKTKDSSSENCSSYIPNVPGIVVELFSEKPKSMSASDSVIGDFVPFDENSKIEEVFDLNSFNVEQRGVKSLWALTKVLLFDDGSKKIEILEASLSPPGYSLLKNEFFPNNQKKNSQ